MEKIYDLKVLKTVLIDGITNGIEANGVVRNFDIVDYYSLTDIPVAEMVSLLCSNVRMTASEKSKIYLFAKRNNYKRILRPEEYMLNCLKDKDIIKGVEVTNEMRLQAFSYLAENNIALNEGTYHTMLRRLVVEILRETEEQTQTR